MRDGSGHHERQLKLIGYQYTKRSYRPIQPDTQGRIFLEPVGLSIGITRDPRGDFDRLACYDPQTGQELGDQYESELMTSPPLRVNSA
jgi:hypothetical protein